jgi:thioredoxin-related protein
MPRSPSVLFALAFVALMVPPPLMDAATASPQHRTPAVEGPVTAGRAPPEQPDWFKNSFLDLRADVTEAADANKRVILYFHQDGCPYCAKLIQEGFGDRANGELTRKHFDVVAIDLLGDRELTGLSGEPTIEKQFAAGLKVQFTPTLLMLDEGGQVILRINGLFPPAKLGAALTYAAERREQMGESFTDFLAARESSAPTGKLREEGGFLPHPLRLADNRDTSGRPLVVLFEQASCPDCDALHQVTLRKEPVAYSLSGLDVAIVDIYAKEPVQTPDGRELPARDWATELHIQYAPSLVFFDAAGREVFRTESYLKSFHLQAALDYVATGAYVRQPSFPRFLAARREALGARGIKVELLD